MNNRLHQDLRCTQCGKRYSLNYTNIGGTHVCNIRSIFHERRSWEGGDGEFRRLRKFTLLNVSYNHFSKKELNVSMGLDSSVHPPLRAILGYYFWTKFSLHAPRQLMVGLPSDSATDYIPQHTLSKTRRRPCIFQSPTFLQEESLGPQAPFLTDLL